MEGRAMRLFLLLGLSTIVGCSNIKTTMRYQAWDSSFPEVSPLFNTLEEAEQYAEEYNMLPDDDGETGHSYIVREVDYKYEVRLQNESGDHQLYTSNNIDDAMSYMEEYGRSHSDLYLYDIIKGKMYAPATP